MPTIDRLVLLTTILFGIAALLVVFSISRPRWILSVNQGDLFDRLFFRFSTRHRFRRNVVGPDQNVYHAIDPFD